MRAVIQRVTSANVSVRKSVQLDTGVAPKALEAIDSAKESSLPVVANSSDPSATTPPASPNEIDAIAIASTQIVQEVVGEIGKGLVVLLGVGREDSEADVAYMVDRTLNLRIFADENDQMNLSLLDVGADVLVVSQFTLYGDARKGRRPSFFEAMDPTTANGLYRSYCEQLEKNHVRVATGRFGANMQVSILNDGPVTILLDSKKEF